MYKIYKIFDGTRLSVNPVASVDDQELDTFIVEHCMDPDVVYIDIEEYGTAQYGGYLIMEERWNP